MAGVEGGSHPSAIAWINAGGQQREAKDLPRVQGKVKRLAAADNGTERTAFRIEERCCCRNFNNFRGRAKLQANIQRGPLVDGNGSLIAHKGLESSPADFHAVRSRRYK